MLLLLLGMLIFLLPSQGTYPTSWACLFLHHPTQHCTSTLDVYICCGWAYGWLGCITAGCLGILPRSLNNTTVCGSFLTGSSASTLVQYNSWWLGSYEEKKSSQGIVVMEWWWVCLPVSIAYEASQSPYICLTLMCDQVWPDRIYSRNPFLFRWFYLVCCIRCCPA